ncbi:MAG: hypothetical protein ACRELC_08210, partial [Gemmatimonadota bacterium]
MGEDGDLRELVLFEPKRASGRKDEFEWGSIPGDQLILRVQRFIQSTCITLTYRRLEPAVLGFVGSGAGW